MIEQTPTQFIYSLDRKGLRPGAKRLMQAVVAFEHFVWASALAEKEHIPDLFVIQSTDIDGHASFLLNRIRVTSATIKHCLSLARVAATVYKRVEHPKHWGRLTIPIFSFLWIYAHEMFHVVRRHHEITNVFGQDNEIIRAIEWDADLLSTAYVFRFLEANIPSESPRNLRLALLTSIFMALRPMCDHGSVIDVSGTHVHMSARLHDITVKLASLTPPESPPTYSYDEPFFRGNYAELRRMLSYLDRLYCEHYGVIIEQSPLVKAVNADQLLGAVDLRSAKWNIIQDYLQNKYGGWGWCHGPLEV